MQPDRTAYDELREQHGYLTVAEIDALVRTGTIIAFVRITADRAGTVIAIGDRTRITDGADLAGRVTVGHGGQILGAIGVRHVTLAAGEDFRHPDPDRRGGVLKGHGTARGLSVGAGEVIAAYGRFTRDAVERQRAHHP